MNYMFGMVKFYSTNASINLKILFLASCFEYWIEAYLNFT